MEERGLHFFLAFLPPSTPSPFLHATQVIMILRVSKTCAVDAVVRSPLEYICSYFPLSLFVKKKMPDHIF